MTCFGHSIAGRLHLAVFWASTKYTSPPVLSKRLPTYPMAAVEAGTTVASSSSRRMRAGPYFAFQRPEVHPRRSQSSMPLARRQDTGDLSSYQMGNISFILRSLPSLRTVLFTLDR